jgi:hypothetical protein
MVTTAREPATGGARRERLPIVDCDVHHAFRSPKDLFPYLPRQYRERIEEVGLGLPSGLYGILGHGATRLDLWGPENIPPTASLDEALRRRIFYQTAHQTYGPRLQVRAD